MTVKTYRCVLCGTETRYTTLGPYAVHQTPSGDRCAASGLHRGQAEHLRRTFRCADEPAFSVKIADGGDHIGLNAQARVGDVRVAEIEIILRGADVRKFIAELTAIADARGL